MATAKEIIKKGKSMSLLAYLVDEVNSYDGSLEHLQTYEFNDDFFNTWFDGNPLEASRATFFGEIQNWNDEYIRFNGYGSLESLTDYQYQEELESNADEIREEALRLLKDGNLDAEYIEAEYQGEVA